MSNDRMMIAIGRIERALSRLESIEAPTRDAFSALQQKYAELRHDTGKALGELDELISRIREEDRG